MAPIRVTENRSFHVHHTVVGVRIGSFGARFHIHHSDFELAQRSRDFAAAIDGHHHFSRGRVDPNLTAEKQQVVEAGGKVKGAGILQKEWALLWEKQLVRLQVELLLIQIGVREISIYREIGHQIRAQPILDIDAARMQRLRIAAFPQTGISRSTYGFKMKSLPLLMSPMPASARYSETLVIPNVLR